MKKRFEYKTLNNCTDTTLNDFGIQGWELVSVCVDQYTKFVFKRELGL